MGSWFMSSDNSYNGPFDCRGDDGEEDDDDDGDDDASSSKSDEDDSLETLEPSKENDVDDSLISE